MTMTRGLKPLSGEDAAHFERLLAADMELLHRFDAGNRCAFCGTHYAKCGAFDECPVLLRHALERARAELQLRVEPWATFEVREDAVLVHKNGATWGAYSGLEPRAAEIVRGLLEDLNKAWAALAAARSEAGELRAALERAIDTIDTQCDSEELVAELRSALRGGIC